MITLRAIEKEDLRMLKRWRNSPEVMPWCRQYRPLSDTNMLNWYESLTKDNEYNLTNDFLIMEYNGTPIGVGGYTRIDWRNRKAEVSFYVGEDTKRTSEVITQALLVLLDYAYETLNLRKVYFPCYQGNPYLPLYKQVLQEEYVAKKEYYWKGQYLDRIVLVGYNDSI